MTIVNIEMLTVNIGQVKFAAKSYPHKAPFVSHSPDPNLFLHQFERVFSHAKTESESAGGLDWKEGENPKASIRRAPPSKNGPLKKGALQ